MTKDKWLELAEVIDALRVIPRLMLLGFFVFYIWYVVWVTGWYFGLTNPNTASTVFISSTITAIGTMFTWFGGNVYMSTGRKWN